MSTAEQSVRAFLDAVASEKLTPSGGAVAAVSGASGTALCEMVCVHTVRADEYDDGETELAEISAALNTHREQLLKLADEDMGAVEQMRSTFQESSSSAERQPALQRATELPLEVAERCLDVLEYAEAVVAEGTERATSDAVTGVWLVYAALQASVNTASVNLALSSNQQFISETSHRIDELGTAGQQAFHRIRTADSP